MALLTGCGDDDSTSTPDAATAAGTKQAGEPTGAGSTAGDGGHSARSRRSAARRGAHGGYARRPGRGDIPAGGVYYIDPQTLAAQDGDVPSCDNFQFEFSWQVTDPYPPDGASPRVDLAERHRQREALT